jgi:hypothetical protein
MTARIEARPATPRFASEEDEEMAPAAAARTAAPAPVFVPVTAREVISAFAPAQERVREPEPLRGEPGHFAIEMEEKPAEAPTGAIAVAEAPIQSEAFGTPPAVVFEPEPSEDLDVPAFMRKGGL